MSVQPETETGTAAAAAEAPEEGAYSFAAMEAKWPQVWEDLKVFTPVDDGSKERRYVLDMFPYPSGDLHMGHAEAFAMGDVVARYLRQQGYDVLHPIGWDSFGLPAENAAIKRNAHPSEWTYANIDTQAASFKRYAISADWSRRIHTSDPEYYRWTQWLFKRFYERGLAYRKNSPVNWCPKDQTVLANEQVVNGACERCGTPVTKKSLNQWYFKITDYADRLLDDMDELRGHWPERVLAMQKNWIGRSEGAHVNFVIEADGGKPAKDVTVFTTRPDTLYGATFFVVAADAPLAVELVTEEHAAALDAYREQVKALTEIERQSTEREKTGVFTGRYAINPLNGEKLPVWAADYVLADYGTGAIMAVPAHDQRDLDFARTFDLPVRAVLDTGEEDPAVSGTATSGEGTLINSGALDGLPKADAIPAAIEILRAAGHGREIRELPPARLAAQPAALLGHPDPDHPLPRLRRGPGPGRAAARHPAGGSPRRGPVPEGHVAAGRRRKLGQRRVPRLPRPGQAGHGHHGHVRGFLLVLPALRLAAVHRRPV